MGATWDSNVVAGSDSVSFTVCTDCSLGRYNSNSIVELTASDRFFGDMSMAGLADLGNSSELVPRMLHTVGKE